MFEEKVHNVMSAIKNFKHTGCDVGHLRDAICEWSLEEVRLEQLEAMILTQTSNI